jgi:hypothetical protein
MTLTTAHRIGRKRTSEYLDSNQQEGTVVINFLQESRPTQEVKASDRWYIYKVTHEKLHHVLSEVSLESVGFTEFTLDCVKEESKQLTIYLRSKPEQGGPICSSCILLVVIKILMTGRYKCP